MKNSSRTFLLIVSLLTLVLMSPTPSKAQGRLVINEFMNWPGSGCGVTSEFIELMNMGPGPMNIGCHVITDGDFSVTIPANTMLGAGQYFVLSGQNTIASGCANINNSVAVNLNWTTCGCTSGVIPTTGDGFLTDGGSASEQLVLFNPSGTIIDAVVRDITTRETSSQITTLNLSSTCSSFTFDLDNLSVNYEEIGESLGRGNSYARKVDGGCLWIKETQQNGGATNNATGETSTLTMSKIITDYANCSGGAATFTVTNPSPSTYFPFNYILGFDLNGDGSFTNTDNYSTGTDNISPSVEIINLPQGRYYINLEPMQGCNQQNFTFEIGPCATMAISLKKFSGISNGKTNKFYIEIEHDKDLKEIQLQSSRDGVIFTKQASIPFQNKEGLQSISYSTGSNDKIYYRLGLVDLNNKIKYSNVVNFGQAGSEHQPKITPNPFADIISFEYPSVKSDVLNYSLISASGSTIKSERINIKSGQNKVNIKTESIPKGIYLLYLKNSEGIDAQIIRVVKN